MRGAIVAIESSETRNLNKGVVDALKDLRANRSDLLGHIG
jgi:hypothetical protein